MVTIVRFGGAKLAMYANDHNPPHVHLLTPDHGCIISLATLEITAGHVPKQSYEVARQWATEHMEDLLELWADLNG